ncbi:MAG: hypothetical protein IT495_15955 [Gammaproteobacteria bacterium]|nr:hypothetical protein [Gammaproteobacteria bacterium]
MPNESHRQLHIGFLFNHDAAHQVSHIAPIIAAFREHYPTVHVLALFFSEEQYAVAKNIVSAQSKRDFACVRLTCSPALQRLFRLTNPVAPVQRLYLLRKYVPLIRNLDCLVVPEMTSSWLKSRLGMTSTPLVLFPHGAGDRAVGFSHAINHYDYVLLAGAKVRDRMLSQGLITQTNHRLVGYPKFDIFSDAPRRDLFGNGRPTVLYNPHFDPRLSSWYDMGEAVLEYFADHSNYNLICAPHVMLFRKKVHISLESKRMRFTKTLANKYVSCANIKFDAGSPCSINMHYISNADIYLGDVSSQVYEFVRHPRPCIFLNSHERHWHTNENYRHWHLGPVLESVEDLDAALTKAFADHAQWIHRQRWAFEDTFDLSDTPSSIRAARAIVEFLGARQKRNAGRVVTSLAISKSVLVAANAAS